MTEDAADSFIRIRAERPKFHQVPAAHHPLTEQQGYQLQKVIHARLAERGTTRCGYKVGAISPSGQRALGLSEPVYAGIFNTTRFASLTDALAAPLVAPAVECEVAAVLGSALDGADHGLTIEDVAVAIETCHVACEVIDHRYSDPLALGIPTLLADDFFHAGFVLGPAVQDWRSLDFKDLAAAVRIDDTLHEANSANVLSALESTLWLAHKLAVHGIILQPGEIILTGAIISPIPVSRAVERLSLSVEGLGSLTLAR